MRERPQPENKDEHTIEGKVIFDLGPLPIGIIVADGSFDYASPSEKEKTVLVIRPQKKDKS